MEELFENWNKLKQDIHINEKESFYVKQREIWYVNLGINIGSEENGKKEDFRRPVLVLKKLGSLYLCVAMTKIKTGTWFCDCDLQGIKRTALLYQIRMLHKNRLWTKIGQIDEMDFDEIKKSLAKLLELS